MSKIVKKRFDILVATAEQKVTETFELDKDITSVKGLLLSSDRDDLMYFRGTQKIEINAEEIFPENYESRLLMCGINVTPHGRYYDLGGIEPGNGMVKIQYQDSESSQTTFEPYRVSLYLSCEIA